jgi:hypothetical protein
MGAVTRVNGLACTAGTIYPVNSKLFHVVVKNTGATAQNIQAQDDVVDEVVEMIVKEINPLAFFVVNGNGGVMHLVTDVNQSAAGLQHRIRQIGSTSAATSADGNKTFTYAVTSLLTGNVDISGTTVTDAVTFVTTV